MTGGPPRSTTAGVTAWVLAAGVFAAMGFAAGPVRVVAVIVLATALVTAHLLAVRSLGTSSGRRFAVLWSVQAGLTWLVAGEPTTTSVLVYVAVGLVFALLAEVVLRVAGRFAADDGGGERRTDTAPLPVGEPEG